jgi:hypothetical protein
MISTQYQLIWRCMYRSRLCSYAIRLNKFGNFPMSSGKLRVVYQCRPYEVGWLLSAFAGPRETA